MEPLRDSQRAKGHVEVIEGKELNENNRTWYIGKLGSMKGHFEGHLVVEGGR